MQGKFEKSEILLLSKKSHGWWPAWPVGAWVISAYRQAMKQIWKCTVEDGQTGVALPRQDLSQSMGGTRFIRSNSYGGLDSVNKSTWSNDCCDLSVTLALTKGLQCFGHWSWSDGWKWACQLYRLRPVSFQGRISTYIQYTLNMQYTGHISVCVSSHSNSLHLRFPWLKTKLGAEKELRRDRQPCKCGKCVGML